jgi:ribosomal protein S18 acetylase RimI-like enzyme
MPSAPIVINRLQDDRVEAAGRMSARALFHDPLAVYALPDVATRAERLAWMNTAYLRLAQLFGRVDILAGPGQPDAVAAWLPPHGSEETPDRLVQAGIDRAPSVLGEAAAGRFAGAFAAMEARLHDVVPTPHWYLFMLVVAPLRQGQGLGSALLRAGLARAAADGVPACLLTMEPRNVAFYTRHGMRSAYHGPQPTSGIPFRVFTREPVDRRS